MDVTWSFHVIQYKLEEPSVPQIVLHAILEMSSKQSQRKALKSALRKVKKGEIVHYTYIRTYKHIHSQIKRKMEEWGRRRVFQLSFAYSLNWKKEKRNAAWKCAFLLWPKNFSLSLLVLVRPPPPPPPPAQYRAWCTLPNPPSNSSLFSHSALAPLAQPPSERSSPLRAPKNDTKSHKEATIIIKTGPNISCRPNKKLCKFPDCFVAVQSLTWGQ